MSSTKIIYSDSPQQTLEWGKAFAGKLKAGDVIGLTGDLGAGKTLLTKGICRGLGYSEDVTSPSYVHVHHYKADIDIYHIDFYLDKSIDGVYDLGIDDLINDNSLVIIEWADKFPEIIPRGSIWISLEWVKGSLNTRKIKVETR